MLATVFVYIFSKACTNKSLLYALFLKVHVYSFPAFSKKVT